MKPLAIICLDGLEPEHVQEWNLKYLLQEFHGTHTIDTIEKNYTPLLFSAFLTGVNPKEYGYTYDYIISMRNFRYNFLFKLHDFIGHTLGLRGLLTKLGLFNRQKRFNASNMNHQQKQHTFIMKLHARNHSMYCLELPSYNEYASDPVYRQDYWDHINKPRVARSVAVKQLWSITLNRWHMFTYASKMCNTSLFYSCLPDMSHHLLFKKGELIHVEHIYRKLDSLIGSLKNVDILIFSDHGFNHSDYTHSEHGFWSTNFKLMNEPESILDFHNVILEHV